MPKYYTEEEIIKDKFLFVSYSHEDKAAVHDCASRLIAEGVRLWYDADLHNGDNWIEIASRMINNENCIGTVFFNSVNSYISDPVADERRLSLEKKSALEKSGGSFHIFVVNIGKPSTMRLVKQVFDSLPDNDKVIRQAITTEQLADIMQLFSDSRIYSYLENDNTESIIAPLVEDMSRRAPEAINSATIVLEEMEKLSANAGITFKMGRFAVDGNEISLEWQYLTDIGNDAVFILKTVLCDRLGRGLEEWLNTQFKKTAFTEDELRVIKGSIRLLSINEAKEISPKILCVDNPWWLSDVCGALQSVVREDGTIYQKGSINSKIEKGVRPVITVDINDAMEIMKKNN